MNNQTIIPPRVEISEQPCSKWRFRYQTEGRSPPIRGVRSSKDHRTFPTIKLIGCTGPGVVIVSTVTKDEPFRVHANSISGRGTADQNGICRVQLAPRQTEVMFPNLGIAKVKRTDVQEALAVKQERQVCGQVVDPYGQGFGHRAQHMDLNCLRLCFQVYLGTGRSLDGMLALAPVVTRPITDVKNNRELEICRIVPRAQSYADGGDEPIVLMCEKVANDGIRIRFFEENADNGDVIWEDFGEFQARDIHKQCAIAFTPPPYRRLDLIEPVVVNVQLLRPSDRTVSEPVRFTYIPRPSNSSVELPAKKKQKTAATPPTQPQNERGNREPLPLASQPPPVAWKLNNLISTANDTTVESAPNHLWNIPLPDYYDVTEPLQPAPPMSTIVASDYIQPDQPNKHDDDYDQFVEDFVQQVLNADAATQLPAQEISAPQINWATELQVQMDPLYNYTLTTATTLPHVEGSGPTPISVDDLSATLSDLIIRTITDDL